MGIVQADAVDNGAGAGTLSNTFPGTCTSGNFRWKLICPRGGVNVSSVAENVGGATWTKRTASTNCDDTNAVGFNAIQVWAPDTHTAASSSATTTLASSIAAIEFFFEDNEIDTSAGFLGGVLWDNGNVAVTSWTTNVDGNNPLVGSGDVSLTGDLVIYEISTSGAGSDVSFTAGSGRTAVSGTGITGGHHGNTGDGDDMFVQRRTLTGSSGTLSALGGSASASQNSAMLVFRKATAASPLHETEWLPMEPQTNPLTISVW